MAMSRKHYEAAAKTIRRHVPAPDAKNGFGEADAQRDTVRSIAVDLADVFKTDNRAFNRDRFMDACGLGDPNGN